MTNPPAIQPQHREGTIIPAQRGGVTALYVQTFLAIIAALVLRLVFVHWFPIASDDSATYLQLANNWLDHHVYGLWQNGQLLPTDPPNAGMPGALLATGSDSVL